MFFQVGFGFGLFFLSVSLPSESAAINILGFDFGFAESENCKGISFCSKLFQVTFPVKYLPINTMLSVLWKTFILRQTLIKWNTVRFEKNWHHLNLFREFFSKVLKMGTFCRV